MLHGVSCRVLSLIREARQAFPGHLLAPSFSFAVIAGVQPLPLKAAQSLD